MRPLDARCEIMEHSAVALVRELREEANETVIVERPLWIVENFFALHGTPRHEIGIYYRVSLPPNSQLLDITHEHAGIEGDMPLIFRWLPIADAQRLPIYPVFLRTAFQAIPDTLQHIVNRDNREAESGHSV